MTNTNKSFRKEEREWQDLQHEKKAYLKRRDEEEESRQYLRFWEKLVKERKEDDDTTQPLL